MLLDCRTQFAEGAMVLGDQKIRVIAEPVFAARLVDDSTSAAIFRRQANHTRGIGESHRTDISSTATFRRDTSEFLLQLRIVAFIGRSRIAIASRIDSRQPLQSVNHQTAVFTDGPLLDGQGGLTGLLR